MAVKTVTYEAPGHGARLPGKCRVHERIDGGSADKPRGKRVLEAPHVSWTHAQKIVALSWPRFGPARQAAARRRASRSYSSPFIAGGGPEQDGLGRVAAFNTRAAGKRTRSGTWSRRAGYVRIAQGLSSATASTRPHAALAYIPDEIEQATRQTLMPDGG